MEMIEIREMAMQMGWTLGATVISLGYMLSMMAIGRITREIVDWLLDWRRK